MREHEPVRAVEVPQHPLRVDDEVVDDPDEAVEHVVEGEERVRDHDPLGRRLRDVALVPERRRSRARPWRPRARRARGRRSARRPSGCACAASRRSPSCPVANGSSTSRTSVRARWRISVANRSSDVAVSASDGQQLGVAVARDHLRRERIRLEAEALAGDPLHLGIEAGVAADGAGELADAVRLERAHEPRRGRGRARTPSRRASSRTSSARRGSRACGRCRSCGGAHRPASRPRRSRGSSPARISFPASWIWSASAVSTTSEEVRP